MSNCTECGKKFVMFSFDETPASLCRSCEAKRSGVPQGCPPSATGSARVSEPEPGADSSGRSAQESGFPEYSTRDIVAILCESRRNITGALNDFNAGNFGNAALRLEVAAEKLRFIETTLDEPENAHPAAGERALARNVKVSDAPDSAAPNRK